MQAIERQRNKYAREQLRFGGAVTCIEIRERGNGSVVIWKAGA